MYKLKHWACRYLSQAELVGTILRSQDVEIVSISHLWELTHVWYFVRTTDEDRIHQEIDRRLGWHEELSEEIASLEEK